MTALSDFDQLLRDRVYAAHPGRDDVFIELPEDFYRRLTQELAEAMGNNLPRPKTQRLGVLCRGLAVYPCAGDAVRFGVPTLSTNTQPLSEEK